MTSKAKAISFKYYLIKPFATKICSLFFLPYITAGKGRTEVYKFLVHMAFPSETYKKWPLNMFGMDFRTTFRALCVDPF